MLDRTGSRIACDRLWRRVGEPILSSAKTKYVARLRALYARENWGDRSSLRQADPVV
jgi:hypothetical protein